MQKGGPVYQLVQWRSLSCVGDVQSIEMSTLVKLIQIISKLAGENWRQQTGVKKDSATNLALALSFTPCQHPILKKISELRVRMKIWFSALIEGTHKEFHLRYLLIDFLHELDDKIDKLMLQHLFSMKIGDQKGNVIALTTFEINCLFIPIQ